MAVTAIWNIKGQLSRLVNYVENPAKTKNPDYMENQAMADVIHLAMEQESAKALQNVIDYAANDEKTDKRYYVTGVNCTPASARDEMMAVKERFGKPGGNVCFHGYQSFAPGDRRAAGGKLTPDLAHTIGVKMAHRLWGDRFQVLVATHLDKAHHLHNHFLLNSVSFKDGLRYNGCTRTYMEMRKASDTLCREYGLSVIDRPHRGKSKQYGEWRAEQEHRPTWRGQVKRDVDAAIQESMTLRQFYDNLRKKGYEIKQGKDISVRPPGKERFVRLARNFGDNYTVEGISKRIQAQRRPHFPPISPPVTVHLLFRGLLKKAKKLTGIRALYYHYLYKMGILPKKKEPTRRQIHFRYREDLIKLNTTLRQIELLHVNHIDTSEQLFLYQNGLQTEIETLVVDRNQLRNALKRTTDPSTVSELKAQIAGISGRICTLRKEVRLSEGIPVRCAEIKEKLRSDKKINIDRGEKKYEPQRGRR